MIAFAESDQFSLGVELELQIVDPQSWDLFGRSQEILKLWRLDPRRLSPEIFQSMIEINTKPCADVHEVRQDLTNSLNELWRIGDQIGAQFSMTGTHPFAHFTERILHPADRYQKLIDRNQVIARRLVIFGVHVHVGMTSGDHCFRMNNQLMRYLPHLLCLSASSPYWEGVDTGLASSRVTVFEASPIGGHPCLLKDWREFEKLVETLTRARAITSLKDLWWDIRPSPGFGTLEIRILDGMATLPEVLSLTAFIHVLCHAIERGVVLSQPELQPVWLTRENKWRAARYGLEAELIQDTDGHTKAFRVEMAELLKTLGPLFSEFKYENELQGLKQILNGHAGYLRQRAFVRSLEGGPRLQTTGSQAPVVSPQSLTELVRFNANELRQSLSITSQSPVGS